jgi:predicted N-formylglutamate amidohydrolase
MDILDTSRWREDCPLIAADESAPVGILNAEGSANVLLVGDHVSNRIPHALAGLGLDDAVFGQHVASDIGTHRLISHLSAHLDAPAVLAGYSRLVVDMNRSLEDPTLIPEISDEMPIPGNRGLTREQRSMRIHCFYRPYRMTIDGMLHRFHARGIVPAFVSIHSFTPRLADRQHRPWQIGLM